MLQPHEQLTPRWSPILERGVPRLTGQRKAYWDCESRFITVAAGGRSLKTEIAKRKLIKRFLNDPLKDPLGYDARYFFSGPTKEQVKAIGWVDLNAMIPKEFIASVNYSQLYIKLHWGPELHLIGLDKPQRIEGRSWNGGVITEFADIKAGSWEANIRPILTDRYGWIILEGRPDYNQDNNEKFEELFNRGRVGHPSYNPQWSSFQWHSQEVMDPAELAEAYETMSAKLVAQEFGGSFESAPGRAYYEFVRTHHVNDAKAFHRPELPLGVSCDFNAEHHTWDMYQTTKEGVDIAFDEVYVQDGTVQIMCNALEDKLKRYPHKNLVFYGDFSGDNRSAVSSHSAWMQVRERFPNAEFMYMRQPAISYRIDMVNGKLKNAKGETRLWVHSRCVNLIEDFDKVTRKMLYSQQKGDKLTHASDNYGYYVVQYRD